MGLLDLSNCEEERISVSVNMFQAQDSGNNALNFALVIHFRAVNELIIDYNIINHTFQYSRGKNKHIVINS